MAQYPTDPTTAFAELGRIKLDEIDLDGVLDRVAGLARRTLPGASEVSVTLVRNKHAYTAAYTGDLALELDEWQYRQGSGPCLEAAAGKTTISVADTASDTRWPKWSSRAAAKGSEVVTDIVTGRPRWRRRPGRTTRSPSPCPCRRDRSG